MIPVAKLKRKPPGPYIACLDPRKDLKKQMASRMVQFRCAQSDEDESIIYKRMYHSLHGNRYRNRNGEDVWAEALKYLGRANIARSPGQFLPDVGHSRSHYGYSVSVARGRE